MVLDWSSSSEVILSEKWTEMDFSPNYVNHLHSVGLAPIEKLDYK